ncbi:MAG: YihY/virulence factor BrkB family protein [Candidatus Riflebacteria bacterium]|nr:YihY/virulence factor BrkB family protein [Candidatus Riflebacteria bacterium]
MKQGLDSKVSRLRKDELWAGKIWSLLNQTFVKWYEDKAPRLGAALAYYTVFSLAPLLIIVIAIAAFAFSALGQQGAHSIIQNHIIAQIRELIGQQGGELVLTLLQASEKPSTGIPATIFGVVSLLFGALGVFGELQNSLDTIWEVKSKPGAGFSGVLQSRLLSFTLVLGTGFLLLVSVVLSAGLAAMEEPLNGLLPLPMLVMQFLNIGFSFLVITAVFALLFKYLSSARVAWGDVWIGAVATALLFTVGKFLIGFYLGRSGAPSAYGAEEGLVILLAWIYYSAQIFFLGAEFTKVYANAYGSRIVPGEDAMPVTEQDRKQQGIPHDRK